MRPVDSLPWSPSIGFRRRNRPCRATRPASAACPSAPSSGPTRGSWWTWRSCVAYCCCCRQTARVGRRRVCRPSPSTTGYATVCAVVRHRRRATGDSAAGHRRSDATAKSAVGDRPHWPAAATRQRTRSPLSPLRVRTSRIYLQTCENSACRSEFTDVLLLLLLSRARTINGRSKKINKKYDLNAIGVCGDRFETLMYQWQMLITTRWFRSGSKGTSGAFAGLTRVLIIMTTIVYRCISRANKRHFTVIIIFYNPHPKESTALGELQREPGARIYEIIYYFTY